MHEEFDSIAWLQAEMLANGFRYSRLSLDGYRRFHAGLHYILVKVILPDCHAVNPQLRDWPCVLKTFGEPVLLRQKRFLGWAISAFHARLRRAMGASAAVPRRAHVDQPGAWARLAQSARL